jgi:uncharacterized membrane protein HdeD (DUF308 family)
MRYELRLHRLMLSMMVTLLVLFVIGLFYLNAQPGGEHFEAVVSLIVVILVGAIFTYMGTVEGIIAFYFGIKHRREFIAYLLLGLLSVSSGFYLAMSQAESLQTVSLIVSPHAFLFGLAQLRMARHMERHPKERSALIVCGLCELGLGVALIWGSRLPSNRVAELLGGVAVLTILQLIPLLFYREVPSKTELEAN